MAPFTIEKESSIVQIIEDQDPLSLIFIAQPVIDQPEDVCLGVISVRDLNLVCHVPKTLLEACCVARVDPENPRLRRLFSNPVGIFDGKLRLSSQKLGWDLGLTDTFVLTQHHPSRQVLS